GGAAPADVAAARLAALEARLKALEAREAGAVRAPGLEPPSPSPFRLSSYVQAQYEHHQDSEDQLQQGGSPLNKDRFLVRRARLRLDGSWQYAALTFEIDGNTTRAPALSVRRAEATLLARPAGARADLPPYAALTAGISEIPFGRELTERHRDRVFMERSASSLAFFPGEPDVGVRLWGGASAFRYAVAVLNGEPLDERTARPPREWNAAKDLVTRLGVDVAPAPRWRVAAGTSFLRGRGFHPGTDATKDAAQWRDLNENSAVDQGEVSAVPGTAATPSQNFARWAVGADLLVAYRGPLGLTTVYGELSAASNLDRGLYAADPILTGIDQRELGYHAAIVQELGRYAIAGFRTDFYDPNADFLLERAGKLVPSTQTLRTHSPVVGLVLPDRARLVFQYDFLRDHFARDARGVPADLRNDRWTLRLQVSL
ncbi:MAG TPA: porin, partial [Polyangiaceae bacterium]|nr:porin [Polyangiaceae bacterium]